jgi:putative MATE family efflux protein
MTSPPVWRTILGLAGPALLQQGLLLTIQLYDQWLTGPFSPAHKAALTTANYLYWFVTSYAVVVTAGATAVVGRLVGGGDLATARRAVGQAVLLGVGFGAAGGVAAELGLPGLFRLLGLPPEEAGFAVSYLRPLAGLLPFYMVEVAGIACLIGAGDTRTAPKVLGTAAVVNVPLAYALSSGWGPAPDLGFVGIAWGTGLSHVVGCLLVLSILARGRFGLTLTAANVWPDVELLRRLLRVSLPAAADSLSVGVFQLVFLAVVGRLGTVALAAHGNAIRIEALGYLSGAAFGTAGVAFVGRALGAGRPDLAACGGWTALALGGTVMTGMGVVFFAFAEPLFWLFCRNEADAPVVEAGVPALRVIAFAMPGLAATIVLTSCLRGAGDTRRLALFTWVGFLGVRLPLGIVLTRPEWHLGLVGAWVAMVTDIYVRAGLFLWRWASGRWKLVRV